MHVFGFERAVSTRAGKAALDNIVGGDCQTTGVIIGAWKFVDFVLAELLALLDRVEDDDHLPDISAFEVCNMVECFVCFDNTR